MAEKNESMETDSEPTIKIKKEPMEEEKSILQNRRRLSSSNIADTLEPMYSR